MGKLAVVGAELFELVRELMPETYHGRRDEVGAELACMHWNEAIYSAVALARSLRSLADLYQEKAVKAHRFGHPRPGEREAPATPITGSPSTQPVDVAADERARVEETGGGDSGGPPGQYSAGSIVGEGRDS